ncbi:MAG TPA: glycine betaine ABC transporter substrate-binding protein, partial [Luteolibacter sp.]|nr:glycine betaine ABC transporter substrate-binding protein [Luteolibacter sp.]
AKGFTEQAILASWMSQVLEASGAECEVRGNMGSTIVFDALRRNSLDLYIDYTGTIWTTVMNREKPVGRTRMFIEVAHHLLEEHGILALGRLGFENSYCLAMRRDRAAELGLRGIADLRPQLDQFVLGGDPEFFGRPEWTRVRDLYQLAPLRTRGMDPTFMYQAVKDGQVDLIAGFSTDGRISAFDLVVLDDPQQAFPPYDALILLSPRAAEDIRLIRALRPLLNSVHVERMRRTNQLVDIGKKSPAAAAATLPRGKAAVPPPNK